MIPEFQSLVPCPDRGWGLDRYANPYRSATTMGEISVPSSLPHKSYTQVGYKMYNSFMQSLLRTSGLVGCCAASCESLDT